MTTLPAAAEADASAGLSLITRRRRGSTHNDQLMDYATEASDSTVVEGPLTIEPPSSPFSRSRRASLHGDQLASASTTDKVATVLSPADDGPGDHPTRPANSFRGGKGGVPLSFNPTFAAAFNGGGLHSRARLRAP